MRFIEDQSSTFARQQNLLEDEEVNERKNGFIWVIIIMVLLGLNIGSWTFCNMVFGHPEHHFSYGLLTKLEKIEPLTGYRTTTVPGGEFRSSKDFYSEVYPLSGSQLRAYNNLLKRNYLWNYKERDPAYFIYGDFVVDSVRPLTDNDLFPRGILVQATADRFPDAKIKLILPTEEPVTSGVFYEKGTKLTVGRSDFAASVIHAARSEDDPVTFTAVPLVTMAMSGQNRVLKTGTGEELVLQTPEWLNIRKESRR